jgi:hypothetical protein
MTLAAVLTIPCTALLERGKFAISDDEIPKLVKCGFATRHHYSGSAWQSHQWILNGRKMK